MTILKKCNNPKDGEGNESNIFKFSPAGLKERKEPRRQKGI